MNTNSQGGWNHNRHYDAMVLRALPVSCRHALDVGCGQGHLARMIAHKCPNVIGIDSDPETIDKAKASIDWEKDRLRFIGGDVMTEQLPVAGFDLIAAVASLHHLPLKAALVRFRDLLRPGGVLVVVGLYREDTIADYATAALAFPIDWAIGCFQRKAEVGTPVRNPQETLAEVAEAFHEAMPGAEVRRRLFFRYSAMWRKPA